MADSSTYPTTLDGDLKALVPTVTPTDAEDFLQLVADAVSKVQIELGTTPSGAFATVAARFAAQDALLATLEPTITANTQTADYTLVLTDAGKVIEMDDSGPLVLTIPTNASVAFPIGTVLEVIALGSGTVTIAPAGGVTLYSVDSLTDIAAQYGTVSLRKRATNTWVLAGLLA